MSKKVFIPPIKSQGIKTKLVPWIQKIVPPLVHGRWLEPFLGTGVVGFNSGFQKAVFGDSNPHIIRFYQSIQSGEITPSVVRHFLSEEGEKLRMDPEDGYQYFREVRDRFNKYFRPLDLLFLSRAGFNGMMRFNRKGEWNIPFCKKPDRFCQSYITKIVNQVKNCAALMKPGWKFYTSDFRDILSQATKEDMIYCDPPYYGRYTDYFNTWSEQDEKDLFNLLRMTPARFILSTWHHNDYRENEMVQRYWSKFNIQTKDHFYHNGAKEENRHSMVEALVFNFELPPAKVSQNEAYQMEQMSFSLV